MRGSLWKNLAKISGIELRPNTKLTIVKPNNSERAEILLSFWLLRPRKSGIKNFIFRLGGLIMLILAAIFHLRNGIISILEGAGFGVVLSLSLATWIFWIIIGSEKKDCFLDSISLSSDWLDFLNKFAKKRRQILRRQESWIIEYGFLSLALKFYQKDPEGFKKAVRLAEDKEEFQILIGVR
jgi:hypothetical protein